MVDMNGGVPLYVEKNMYHADAAGETDINIFQGYQTLDGKEATGYMRYLDGNGYVSRTQRQERFIKNFYEDRQKGLRSEQCLLHVPPVAQRRFQYPGQRYGRIGL